MNSTVIKTDSALKQQVNGQPGYGFLKMTEAELNLFRALIREQWLYRIQLLVPDKVHQFYDIEMDQYHQLAHLIDHANVWPKTARIMTPRAVATLREMSFMQDIEKVFGPFKIGDDEKFGWDHIVWRLVRPGKSDIGPIHADEWFYKFLDLPLPEGYQRVKVWVAIYCDPQLNGLKVLPGSHLETDKWNFTGEMRHGILKPVFNGDEETLPTVPAATKAGEMIVFNHNLLHSGMANNSATTRVSAEFTIYVKESP